jgi:small-conductance mechanosensitive channel
VEVLDRILPGLLRWLPAALTLAVGALVLVAVDRGLKRRGFHQESGRIIHQLVMLALSGVLVVAFVLALDIESSQKNQLLSLLGLLLSGAIALSSTTFLGNAIAGLMIRAVGGFKPGDFVEVGEFFGRVSDRGLLHVEIQSDARDLITLPNLHMVANPVKVVRASGTIVSADVSLGYDVDRVTAEQLLLQAAEAADLSDAFVRVMALSDHAVSYRVSGFLEDVKHLLSVRSQLHAQVLDALHGGGVEIVSPTFMNQRVLAEGQRFAADPTRRRETGKGEGEAGETAAPEDIVFDKAESAAFREQLRQRHERLVAARAELAGQGKGEGREERERTAQRLARMDEQIERLALALAEEPEDD